MRISIGASQRSLWWRRYFIMRYVGTNHKYTNDKRFKWIAYAIIVFCIVLGLKYSGNIALASDTPANEITADTTAIDTDTNDTEEKADPVTPTKYGILIADSKGKYTFYDLNGEAGTQRIEVTTSGKVMVPLRKVCSYLPDVQYSYDFGTGKASLVNSKTGKRIVITKDRKTVYTYASSKAKAKKVTMSYKMYLSKDSNAAMVGLGTLKNIFRYLSGYKYYNSTYIEKAGYDTTNYIGIIVYNPYRKVTSLPKAINVKYYSEKIASNIVKVTIPEGYSVAQIVDLLVSKGVCASKAVLFDVCNNYDFSKYTFIADLGKDETRCFRLEGYLYPDTYEFYRNSNGYEILDKMLKNTKSKLTQADYDRAAELGYTMDEVLRIASIVEKEVGDASKQGLVSSVLHNRLNIGMKLQCDATSNYLDIYIHDFIDGDNTRYDNYYDTTICKALPSGAICNPGRTAINAALYPEETKYFFFCSDAKGEYYFAETYDEHKINLALTEAKEENN